MSLEAGVKHSPGIKGKTLAPGRAPIASLGVEVPRNGPLIVVLLTLEVQPTPPTLHGTDVWHWQGGGHVQHAALNPP